MDNKLVTYESWIYNERWWKYQQLRQDLIPYAFIDRSPCQDPYLDHFRPAEEATPLVSGLCRTWKNFHEGMTLIYLSLAGKRVLQAMGNDTSKRYFAVAALRVKKVWDSHEEYASSCPERSYVSEPSPTPFPPNLAVEPSMPNAKAQEGCILHDANDRAVIGNEVGEQMYRANLKEYFVRNRKKNLNVAECEFIQTPSGRYARNLLPEDAKVLEPADWAPFIKAENASFQSRIYGHDIGDGYVSDLVEVCFE